MEPYRIGRVYRIIALQSNEFYIGSTFNELRHRWQKHKGHYEEWKKGKGKCSVFDMFEKYGVENCKIILIKEYQVVDRRHLEVYESLWILKLKSINKNIPVAFSEIKRFKRMADKRYAEINKEKIREYKKQYVKNNTEKIAQYKEHNKDKIKQREKKYREKNKEKLNQKITCECGSIIVKRHLSDHIKSNKHKDYILNKK